MLLNNVTLINESKPVTIAISGEKIITVKKEKATVAGNIDLDFTDAIAFPGLINSHDHLDFNCFSPLGNKTYNNYAEWGNHIHQAYKEEINAVLKIPSPLRTAWGMYKNLLAGVTTVINHGHFLQTENPLITIHQQLQNLHSVKFQKKWKWKLNNPLLKNKTVAIHVGEGTDDDSANEIDELLQWNLLNRKLVGVHAVAMNGCQAKKFAGLVWCPEANQLLLNKHADIAGLKENTKLVFGTDSTLTGNWNIWHHLRVARKLQLVSDEELFSMVTSSAALLWAMNNGAIQPGKDADIVIAKTRNSHATWDDFFSVDPAAILLVVQKGNIRLFDEAILPQLNNRHTHLQKFSRINMNGITKFVEGDVPALLTAIRSFHQKVHLPENICASPNNKGND